MQEIVTWMILAVFASGSLINIVRGAALKRQIKDICEIRKLQQESWIALSDRYEAVQRWLEIILTTCPEDRKQSIIECAQMVYDQRVKIETRYL